MSKKILEYWGENYLGHTVYKMHGCEKYYIVDGHKDNYRIYTLSPLDDPDGEPGFPLDTDSFIINWNLEKNKKSREECKFIIAKMIAANEYKVDITSDEWLNLASSIHDLQLTKELVAELKDDPMELVFVSGYGWLEKNQAEALPLLKAYGFDLSDHKFRYQMLSRLQFDCEYYLGFGCRSVNRLWAHDEKEQIELMKALYNSFHEWEKPEWISMEDISDYEEKMVLPGRIIKTYAGMTGEFEIFRTNAPNEVIEEHLREIARLSQEGVSIENPYFVIESKGFFANSIACQEDDELEEILKIDAEFDEYDYYSD